MRAKPKPKPKYQARNDYEEQFRKQQQFAKRRDTSRKATVKGSQKIKKKAVSD
jgi:hypothetical protein